MIPEQPFSSAVNIDAGLIGPHADTEESIRTDHLSASVDVATSSSTQGVEGISNEGNDAESPSARFYKASQDIYMTTTVDWLAASEATNQSSFSYYVEEVDTHLLSPFDDLNWKRINVHIGQMGSHEPSVAAAILATQALYRAQVNRLPMSYAMSLYHTATASFESIVDDDAVDFPVILVVAFLLCLSMVILPNDDSPIYEGFGGFFATRLEAWLQGSSQSPAMLRITIWLQFLNAAVKRGGSQGLFSNHVTKLLHHDKIEVPVLSLLDHTTLPADAIYDYISAPIFCFYIKLQRISDRVADVSHYRRSRITSEDQAEACDILTNLSAELHSLWEGRPEPLRYQPSELRKHFCHTIAESLIDLVGACTAAFYTEIIAIGRTLGDPPLASSEAKQAMLQIRRIVEAGRDASRGHAVKAGYLRPLFLYAIETLYQDETQWAVECLQQIKDPMARSHFVATFVDSLGSAQRERQGRVTTKYFCYQIFGVPIPHM